MSELITLKCDPYQASECSLKLYKEIKEGNWVKLHNHMEGNAMVLPHSHPCEQGPGIVIASSGSTGDRHYCFQPCTNLNQSAFATGEWLKAEGINPNKCKIFNPLPLNHVSGLMPWWRSLHWEVEHEWISPHLMRNPSELASSLRRNYSDSKPLILSLVPTQLKRLVQNNNGIEWLKSFTVIWVGGAPLPKNLSQICIDQNIRLAPCYGATETMAMVTALSPKSFLKGQTGVGKPLMDVELRLGINKGLQIRTQRLAIEIWRDGKPVRLKNKNGWWNSGDSAEIISKNNEVSLHIKGRLDNAIHSGGETIFPSKLQKQLLNSAKSSKIPIEYILLTPVKHEEWGSRLIALISLDQDYSEKNVKKIFTQIKGLVRTWLPAEKPYAWYHCKDLRYNSVNKLDLDKWVLWSQTQEPIF